MSIYRGGQARPGGQAPGQQSSSTADQWPQTTRPGARGRGAESLGIVLAAPQPAATSRAGATLPRLRLPFPGHLAGGFPDGSVGKESACNAGDPGLIPGLGRSPGEGIGYPLQYSWTSLVPQLVKDPSAMWETWVRSLGWEDPLEKGKATHSSILVWRIPWTVVHGVAKSWT